jgi:hypothetical protein
MKGHVRVLASGAVGTGGEVGGIQCISFRRVECSAPGLFVVVDKGTHFSEGWQWIRIVAGPIGREPCGRHSHNQWFGSTGHFRYGTFTFVSM